MELQRRQQTDAPMRDAPRRLSQRVMLGCVAIWKGVHSATNSLKYLFAIKPPEIVSRYAEGGKITRAQNPLLTREVEHSIF